MALDGLPVRATPVADWAASIATRAPGPTTVARVGLGAMAFVTGVHKLLDPLSWSVCAVPWLAPVFVVSPVTLVFANGVFEVGFDATIVADRYTAPASAVTAVSLSTTCLYLVVMFVVESGLFGDVFVRDIGFAGLAWVALIDSFRRPTRTP